MRFPSKFILVLCITTIPICYSESYHEVILDSLDKRDVRVAGFMLAFASQYNKNSIIAVVNQIKSECSVRELFVKALRYASIKDFRFYGQVFEEATINATQGSCTDRDGNRKQPTPGDAKLTFPLAMPSYAPQYLFHALNAAIETAFSIGVYSVINGDNAYTAAAVSATIISDEISANVGLFKTTYLDVSFYDIAHAEGAIVFTFKDSLKDAVGKIFGQCSYETVSAVLQIIIPPSFHNNIKQEVQKNIGKPENIISMPKVSEAALYLRIDKVASQTFSAVAPQLLSVVDSTCQQWSLNNHVNISWNQHIHKQYNRIRNFSSRMRSVDLV